MTSGCISSKRQPYLRSPPSEKITEFLLLKGISPEHRKLLVDLKMKDTPGIPRKRTTNVHLKDNAASPINLEIGRKIFCLIDERMGHKVTLTKLNFNSIAFLRCVIFTNNLIFLSLPFLSMTWAY